MLNSEFQQFLKGFEPEFQNQIAAYGKLKTVTEDSIILDVREPILFIPIITHGIARVTRRDGKGNSLFFHYLTSLETCGISFLNASQKKTNTVRIISKTELTFIKIPIEIAIQGFFKFEKWRHYILKQTQEQNESLVNLINKRTFEKLEVILKDYLIYLQDKFQSKSIYTSHQDVARDLFVSRESISRNLKIMEKEGFLKLGRNKIHLN